MKINEVQNKIDPKRFCIANKAIRKIGYKRQKEREKGRKKEGKRESTTWTGRDRER